MMHSQILEKWAEKVLNKPLKEITVVVNTPWSSVLKIQLEDEIVYLKQMPEQIALEADIINVLRNKFHAQVPVVIAQTSELHCFLMKDAGRSLREILKQNFDADLFCRAVDQFAKLQISIANNLEVLFDIGVPDWRIGKLPLLYKEAISQKDWLVADGLSESEIGALEERIPVVVRLCKDLSRFPIKDTLVQPDFNDNNNLLDEQTQTITLIDLGEIVISHPFFSLLNGLYQMIKRHGLTEEDERYLKIKEACFKNYRPFLSKEDLLEALHIAQILWLVYGVLGSYRLVQACGYEKLIAFQPGKMAATFREFIARTKS